MRPNHPRTYAISKSTATSTAPKKTIRSRMTAIFIAGAFAAILSCGVVHASTAAGPPSASISTTTPAAATSLIISALQTAGCTDDTTPCPKRPASNHEYIELYNPSFEPLIAHNWIVCYRPANSTRCNVLATLNGSVDARSHVLISHTSLAATLPDSDFNFGSPDDTGKLALGGGFVEVRANEGTTVDQLGWDSATSTTLAPAAAPGETLQRIRDTSNNFIDTKNNTHDFQTTTAHVPQSGGYTPNSPDAPEPIPNNPDATPDTTPNPVDCQQIIISEIFPNPDGSDTGLEYIELHNPTASVISPAGCQIQINGSAKTYSLHSLTLMPGEYTALTDTTTGLTLPNSSGGTVLLFTESTDIQSITYPPSMEDDTSWALADGTWATTYNPTPNQPNIIESSKPCPVGQVRNSETNRCVTASSDDLTPAAATKTSPSSCPTGQERNPETNRCRTIKTAAAAAALTPCKEGQERNPETNRCRNTATSINAQSCPAGQERNPTTNRCRKIAAAGTVPGAGPNDSIPISDTTPSGKPYKLIIATALGIILAYGIYEWRQELRLCITRLLRKTQQKQPQTSIQAMLK